MSSIYANAEWTCPSCQRSVILAPGEVSFADATLPLAHSTDKLLVVEAQTVNCRKCSFYAVEVAVKRVQLGISGQPQRDGRSRVITNHTFLDRQLIPGAGVGRIYSADVVPVEIIQDYSEAHAIVGISPRAAAILARRCLQQVLLREYSVKTGKSLHAQLEEVRESLDDQLFKALLTVKAIANEAAHDLGELADVDTNDVLIMMRAIDYLIDDTYVRRQRRKDDLSRVVELVSGSDADSASST